MWRHATTPAGINAEFRPWMRMTVPGRLRHTSLDEVELGVRLCRSWVLLLAVVPFEYDDLVIVERGPGLRFLERSSTLVARTWQHERTVTPRAQGSRIEDRLTFEPRALTARLPGGTRLHTAVIRTILRHRHRRLVRSFGAA